MSATESNIEALSKAVRARRSFLGISRQTVRGRGGPSHQTTANIENAIPWDYRGVTLARLDAALEWPQGTCERILDDITTGEEFIFKTAGPVVAIPAAHPPTVHPPTVPHRRRSGGYWYVDGSTQPLGWVIKEQWLVDQRHSDDKPIGLFSSQAMAELACEAVNALLNTDPN